MEIKTQIYYSNFIFHIGFDHASKCQQPKVGWILGNVDTGWWLQAIIIPWQENRHETTLKIKDTNTFIHEN